MLHHAEELVALPAEGRSNPADYYVGVSWGKPWILQRREFQSVGHFLYACEMSDFVVAEGRADKTGGAEDLEGEARIAAFKSHGKCVFGGKVREYQKEVMTFEWEDKQGASFKPGDDIVLSRTDPDVDGWKHMGKLLSRQGNTCCIYLSACQCPPDILENSWRLDVHVSDKTTAEQLMAIYTLASQHNNNPRTDVLINAAGTDVAARVQFCC